jgi:hypothetical protein
VRQGASVTAAVVIHTTPLMRMRASLAVDIRAILERHTADEMAPIERILNRQSLARRFAVGR